MKFKVGDKVLYTNWAGNILKGTVIAVETDGYRVNFYGNIYFKSEYVLRFQKRNIK